MSLKLVPGDILPNSRLLQTGRPRVLEGRPLGAFAARKFWK
jgi:hypothetical protein